MCSLTHHDSRPLHQDFVGQTHGTRLLFPGLLLPDQAVSKTDTKTETEWQELLDFINLWQLDQACADYLVTQAPCGGVRNNGASWVAYR